MFCFHKWGKIEDGYQYCSKCGVARTVSCSHIWGELGSADMFTFGKVTGRMYVLKCNKCGEIAKRTV